MTEMNQKIFDMIAKNASVNEICIQTGLSNKQLFYRLNMFKIKGFNFSRKYYSDGEICYKLDKGFTKEKEISLITKPNEQKIKIVFLSDLHLCSEKQRLDLLHQVYELCIKEDIHIIINGGDFIDGLIGPSKKMFDTYEKQIEYALKNHPFDKNILNFICLGNHDIKSLETTGQDLETVLTNKRHDIISLGYGCGALNIKNDKIVVIHPDTPIRENIQSSPNGRITLYGHGHIMGNTMENNHLKISLPSLSDVSILRQGYATPPSIVISTLDFKNGCYENGVFEQYIFLDKMYKVNKSEYELFRGKNMNLDYVKYEEDRTPYKPEIQKEKILEKTNSGMSQLEKFNKRYGTGHIFTGLDK